MGKHEVTIVTDWTVPMASVHSAIWVPPPPPPNPVHPHFEMPAMMGHLPGIGKHKFTSTVFHAGLQIAKDGHDVGILIPHLTAPVHSVLLIWHLSFSSRKIMFGASTVKMDGDPAGIADLTGGCPMLMCAEPVSLPIQWAPTNMTNTVYIGSTGADLVLGWLAVAGTMALDFILSKAGDAMGDAFKKWMSDAFAAVMSKLVGEALKWIIGETQNAVSDAFESDGTADGDGDAATAATSPATSTTSSPFGDASVSLTPNSDGSFSASTRSPSSGGGVREERYDNLGLFGPADEPHPQQPDDPFQHAPML